MQSLMIDVINVYLSFVIILSVSSSSSSSTALHLGTQLELKPEDLRKAANAEFADIVVE